MQLDPLSDACALAAVDLVAEYDGRRVLDGVTLPVARGRITVLVGPSGVGKTTCIRHLVGLADPLHGQVVVQGRDRARMSPEEVREWQRRMSVMLQGSHLFGAGLSWSLSVFENVALPLRTRESLGEDEIAELVRFRLAQVGLAQRAHALPAELSAGMLQRVSLARALVSNSELVVLDSIETGMDEPRLQILGETIHSAQRDSGATFLVATHHPELARALGDVLAVMRRGRIDALGTTEEVLRDGASFAARFLDGDRASGLGMADELEELYPAPAAHAQPAGVSDRRVTVLTATLVIAMAAIALMLLISALIFHGPSVPPGP